MKDPNEVANIADVHQDNTLPLSANASAILLPRNGLRNLFRDHIKPRYMVYRGPIKSVDIGTVTRTDIFEWEPIRDVIATDGNVCFIPSAPEKAAEQNVFFNAYNTIAAICNHNSAAWARDFVRDYVRKHHKDLVSKYRYDEGNAEWFHVVERDVAQYDVFWTIVAAALGVNIVVCSFAATPSRAHTFNVAPNTPPLLLLRTQGGAYWILTWGDAHQIDAEMYHKAITALKNQRWPTQTRQRLDEFLATSIQ
jgi:hypothetical protein